MREKARDAERLKHILDAVNGILENREIYSFEDVDKHPIIFYGFVKYLEIIGEAVYMLSKEFRKDHPEIDWGIIEKMRHVLVHGYYQISRQQLWMTIENDIPELLPVIKDLYEKEISNGFTVLEEPAPVYGKDYIRRLSECRTAFDVFRLLQIL